MKSRYWTIAVISIILISMVTTGLFSEGVEADDLNEMTEEASDEKIIGETGKVTLENTIDNGHYKTVEFENEYEDPVVVAFIMTRNGGQSVDTRVRNVEGSSCEIFMEEPDDGGHLSEEVGYMVMEKGVHAINDDYGDGIVVEAGTVLTSEVRRNGESCEGEEVDFSSAFTRALESKGPVITSPALLHTLNTHNNDEFMTTSVSSFNYQSFKIQQEAAGSGSSSDYEEIGWIAIENTPLTSIDDVLLSARYVTGSGDFGVDDSPIHHTLPNVDTDTAIVISKGVSTNDDDGYWTRASGDFFSDSFGVYAEEDQVEDDERSHGSEYLSYMVTGDSIIFREVDSDGDGLADQLELRMTQKKEYEFVFDNGFDYEDDTYELEIDSTSGGTTDPTGTQEYEEGREVTIVADPNDGYEFAHWSGDVSGTSSTINVEIDDDKYIKANFEEIEVETCELTIDDGPNGYAGNGPGTETITYEKGKEVTVSAAADFGYELNYWSGDVSGTSTSITVEMDEDKYIKAHFTESDGGGGGGCPYVSPWTGEEYERDNNLLIDSEYKDGVVEDYYLLENDIEPINGQYRLKVEEFKNTENYFDQIGLYIIDHPEEYCVGTTPEGELVAYEEKGELQSKDNYLIDSSLRLDLEEIASGELSDSSEGIDRYLVIRAHNYESRDEIQSVETFDELSFGGDHQIKSNFDLTADYRGRTLQLDVFEDAEIYPRNHESDILIPVSSIIDELPSSIDFEELELVINNDGSFYLESISIVESTDARVRVHETELERAAFNGRTDVTEELSEDGSAIVRQRPGDEIVMVFDHPGEVRNDYQRSFMLYSKGYYQLYEGEVRMNDGNNILSTDEHGPYHVQEWHREDIQVPGFVQEVKLEVHMKSGTLGNRDFNIRLSNLGNGLEFDETVSLTNSYTTKIFTKEYVGYNSMNRYNDANDWRLTIESKDGDVGVYVDYVNVEFVHSPNPYDPDSSRNGLSDYEEVYEYGTDPLEWDTSGNGLSDYDEIFEYGTDPLKWDTSGNGLSDYDEIYVLGTDPLRWDTSGNGLSDLHEVENGTDPLEWDTSGDGISDYDALNGYEAVYFSYNDDGEIEEHTRTINNADPLTAYKTTSGSWRDTDRDGIPDIFESDPGRIYEPRFNRMPWIQSLRRFEQEFNNSDCEEEQEFFDNAFNPHTQYQGVPIIEDLEVKGTYESRSTGAEVTIRVYDPSGIRYIKITNYLESELIPISPSDVDSEGIVEKTVSLDTKWTYWVNSWDLDIEVMNGAGNVYEENTIEVDGIFSSYWDVITNLAGTIISFGEWIWNRVTDALSSAVDTIVEMANALVDWVEEKLSQAINALVNSVQDIYSSMLDSYVYLLQNVVQSVENSPSTHSTDSPSSNQILSSNIDDFLDTAFLLVESIFANMMYIVATFGIFLGVEAVITAVTAGFSNAISQMLVLSCKELVIGAMLAGGGIALGNSLLEVSGVEVSPVTESLFNIVGISTAYVGAVTGISEVFMESIGDRMTGKGFFVGLTMTLVGFLHPAAVEMLQPLSGTQLWTVDMVGIGIAVFGLVLMLVDKVSSGAQQIIGPWTSLAQWLIGVSGVGTALVTAANHYSGGDWS